MSAEQGKNKQNKRKRVNRMKSLIIVLAVILLFTSVVLNFALVLKVLHLEQQVSRLYSDSQFVVSRDIII